MPDRSRKYSRDANQLAKQIVELAIESDGDDAQKRSLGTKDPAAVALGRKGGLKGGRARADSLTPEQRSEIAKKAAAARYRKAETK